MSGTDSNADGRDINGPRTTRADLGVDRPDLRADCANCFGLCCVVPAFTASADFALTKGAGQPCPNLGSDSRCGIHTRLREDGFKGCTVYDCFGAGQQVSQVTFGGRDWRGSPETARRMFAAFPVVRDLRELLRYLVEALALPAAQPIHNELRSMLDETERLAGGRAEELAEVDVAAHRQRVNTLLLRASGLARSEQRPGARDLRGADLVGARLGRADLRRASLRGARLIGADLRGADLTAADVTGADFRDADLRGAQLSGTLFLIQSQLDSARGDGRTALPPSLVRPRHWAAGDGRRAGSSPRP